MLTLRIYKINKSLISFTYLLTATTQQQLKHDKESEKN